MAGNHFSRVGAVRPSHLMFTTGVGALVDLPNISVLVRGLDDWRHDKVPDWEAITEPRVLDAVQRILGKQVKELRPAPWLDGADRDPAGPAGRVGVPVVPFPGWLRCTVCDELGPIDSGAFGFDNANARKPHEARFFHAGCRRKVRSRKKPLAVAARFLLACTDGHLDDFPYARFVHHGGSCPEATHPTLKMDDRGGNLGANVEIKCMRCEQRRNMREVFGPRGADKLPRCRGRRPHLGDFETCKVEPKVLVVGASNQWFAQTLSALAVPPTGASELDAKVDKHWDKLENIPDLSIISYLRTVVPVFREMVDWSDDEIRAAIEARRAGPKPEPQTGNPDLRSAEWEIFSARQLPEPTDDFTLRRDPAGVPARLKGCYADVVQAERLREVRAMVGFTRLDAPDPDDPDLVTRVALARGDVTWVPASEVRGEGIFLRLPEDLVANWEQRVATSAALAEHRDAYARFRSNRYSARTAGRLPGGFDPMRNWPGARFIALHTLSHLLIRTIALECGYSSASLSERIYPSRDDDPRAGILIYTAVPDAEGTLGGLVSQAEEEPLVRLTRRALATAMHCSSDPLCAERLPQEPADFLHGAACHVCLFVSETTCERGNRFLDRRFVVPIDDPDLALFPELP
ncbi:DUF1998 domain-containing protein [Polymorphospora sp. NPDC051019]|uniref:DUF1998 domain-containing protein n=1 Tax=Polymorphospora sp. NPDC051019 TaxID=3155725 RepID=UPI00341A9C2D